MIRASAYEKRLLYSGEHHLRRHSMYFQDDSDTVSNDFEGTSTPQRDLSPSDSEEEQIQPGPSRRRRGSTRSRAQGRAPRRASGWGRGIG